MTSKNSSANVHFTNSQLKVHRGRWNRHLFCPSVCYSWLSLRELPTNLYLYLALILRNWNSHLIRPTLSPVKYVPSWFPGAGFQKRLKEIAEMSFKVLHPPFEEAKRDVVSAFHFSSPFHSVFLLCETRGKDGRVVTRAWLRVSLTVFPKKVIRPELGRRK